MYYYLSWLILRAVLPWLTRLESRGTEHIPRQGGVVICCNHISFMDPLVLGAADPRWPIRYMAKEGLWHDWRTHWFVKRTYAFPVKRGGADRGAWRQFADYVAKGDQVAFFPEGTRSPDGRLQPPNPGAGMLLHRCKGAVVVPARVWGTDQIMHREKGWRGWHPVAVIFGPPVDLGPEWEKEGSREVYQSIAEKVMASIAAIPPPGNGADKSREG